MKRKKRAASSSRRITLLVLGSVLGQGELLLRFFDGLEFASPVFGVSLLFK